MDKCFGPPPAEDTKYMKCTNSCFKKPFCGEDKYDETKCDGCVNKC